MRSRRLVALVVAVVVVAALAWAVTPYVRAASLVVRAADLGGPVEAFANERARAVTVSPPQMVPTRQGGVPARLYEPAGSVQRTVLLVPGIHSMGIEEPRLRGLANDLAGSGVRTMTLALPDLQRYRVTAQSSDTIEDAVAWMARQPTLRRTGASASSGSASRAAFPSWPPAAPPFGTRSRSSCRSGGTATCLAS